MLDEEHQYRGWTITIEGYESNALKEEIEADSDYPLDNNLFYDYCVYREEPEEAISFSEFSDKEAAFDDAKITIDQFIEEEEKLELKCHKCGSIDYEIFTDETYKDNNEFIKEFKWYRMTENKLLLFNRDRDPDEEIMRSEGHLTEKIKEFVEEIRCLECGQSWIYTTEEHNFPAVEKEFYRRLKKTGYALDRVSYYSGKLIRGVDNDL